MACLSVDAELLTCERSTRLAPGRVERRTHDYLRHGTITLFAALEVATGRVTDACQPHHRHSEFRGFLKLVARAYPRRQLHVVLDNDATHKHERVHAWLARHPRVRLHFTPTYASWLNLVEGFFASSNARRCAAATSPAWRSWSRPSVASATGGTSAVSRFVGPRTPSSSWPRSSVPPVRVSPTVAVRLR
jgi:transposase